MYNNFNQPYSFNPAQTYLDRYNNLQQQQQFNQQTQPQNTTQPTINPKMQNVNWIQVNGVEGAKGLIVQPNQTTWAMDTNDTVFFVKSADSMGVSTLRKFRFTEEALESNESNQTSNNTNFVKKSEFNALEAKINALEDDFNRIINKREEITSNKTKKRGND